MIASGGNRIDGAVPSTNRLLPTTIYIKIISPPSST